jgi:hypothetical protein
MSGGKVKFPTLTSLIRSPPPINFYHFSHNVFEICNSNLEPCLVCHLAKQTRIPFSTSSIFSISPFALLDVGIWAGLHTTSLNGVLYFFTIV